MAEVFSYLPNHDVPPGELLQDYLEEQGMSARELARRCGRSAKLMAEIISGKAPIEPDTALQLERVLGMDAVMWLTMEARYRLALAKSREETHLAQERAWAAAFPLKELVRRGHLKPATTDGDSVRQLLVFFGVASVSACREHFAELANVSYRHSPSFASEETALLTWLRLGQKAGEALRCDNYDRSRFLEALRAARSLTQAPVEDALPQLEMLCSSAGVAFVLVRPFKGVALSGISRWLTPRKALIQQSLRHKANDHFWFTFFHEAAHLLLHSRKSMFLDESNYGSAEPTEEREANEWASNFLVPANDLRAFIASFGGTAQEVKDFALVQGIAPGIVVGQLQKREVIGYNELNKLKVSLQWSDG